MIRQAHPHVKPSAPRYPVWADCPYWQGFYLYGQGHNLSELPLDDPTMRRGWWAANEAEGSADAWQDEPGYELSTQPYKW